MGAATNNTGWTEATAEPPVSRGVRRPNVACEVTLSNSYNGGENVEFPVDGTLRALFISPTICGGYHLTWDGGNPPRIKAYTLDGHEAAKEMDLSHITVNLLAFYEA